MPFVNVTAIAIDNTLSIPEGASQAQGEEVVQSWQRIAVLEASPDIDVFFGFKIGDHAQFMNTPVQTDNGKFGARIGDGDVSFFVIPKDMESRPLLRLVAITDIDDPKYSDLPLY